MADGVFGLANREATTSRLTTHEPMGAERVEKINRSDLKEKKREERTETG